MKFNIITIFPHIISNYCNESILKRGQKAGSIIVNPVNLRDYATDKHKTVDDSPYGGGAGMVMKPEPIYAALKALKVLPSRKTRTHQHINTSTRRKTKRTVLLSPRGRQFDQRIAEEWGALKELTLICGRYEGVDQRVVDYMVDEEISVGQYVLAGGELGALVIIEAISRLIPGVLGNPESLAEETFTAATHQHNNTSTRRQKKGVGVLECSCAAVKEYPHYTKPAVFKKWPVPGILLSGDHKRIKEWRQGKTKE